MSEGENTYIRGNANSSDRPSKELPIGTYNTSTNRRRQNNLRRIPPKFESKEIGIFVLVCLAILVSVVVYINVNVIGKRCKNDECKINSEVCGNRNTGLSRVKRIVGGTEARENSWPWQVLIEIGDQGYFGGGTLITDRWVLTAAHLVKEMKGKVGISIVKIDELRLKYKIKSVHIHPQFNLETRRYDIALVKLHEKVDFGGRIYPVCLPEAKTELPPRGTECYATGWGKTETQKGSNELREVDLELISQKMCKTTHGYGRYINDDVICAINYEGLKGTCQGDSGGPLVYLDPKNEKWTQIGITNWAVGCGKPGYPGVYQRVDFSRAWIDETINEN